MNLREWQKQASEFFLKNNNCILNVTTGAGKSFQAIYLINLIIDNYDPNVNILIVAPKNVILEKTWLIELHNQGFPINRVGLYNEFAKEFSKVTLISIQSLKSLISRSGRFYESDGKYYTTSSIYNMFDFVIFDEVHNYGTENYMKILRLHKKYKIGLSATVKREDMRHSLISESFGYNTFVYGIKEAISDSVLNPFDFINVQLPINRETLEVYEEITLRINNAFQMRNNKVNAIENDLLLKKLINERKQLIYNYYLKFTAVKEIVQQNKGSKILVFNQYNKTSKNLYWELFDIGVKSDIMNSDINRFEQSKIFKRFENDETDVLLATTMLDEGYNLPKIDVAIIMAANSTEKQFYQRMGRVLRKKDINSKVYYLTVDDTFEVDYLGKHLPLIKDICNSYEEVRIE